MNEKVVEYFVQDHSPDREVWQDLNMWDPAYKYNGYPDKKMITSALEW